ncbi:MAG: guanylate kinase [Clostridia bacterium]|nr:guanylate kinase [Clostridia bacterium]
MSKKGMLIVLSGPSGSGKGTIISKLLKMRDDTVLSISMTTRSPREGEVDGVHYFFTNREEFEQMQTLGAFLESAEYNGNYYGTPESTVRNWLAEGKNVILEIEVQGAEKVMDFRSDLVSIFITIPSMDELYRRLKGRGTEDEETINKRMAVAKRELQRAFRYDYVVINDEVDQAVERINTIIEAEQMRFARMDEDYIKGVLENAQTE